MAWQFLPNLEDRFNHILENEILTDTVIHIGEGDKRGKIYCHKLILAMNSPVFETMFNERWDNDKTIIDGSRKKLTEIFLPHIDPRIFKIILKYMYTNNLELDEKDLSSDTTLLQILRIGKLYMLERLVCKCTQVLTSPLYLNEITALRLYQESRTIDADEINHAAFSIICRNGEKIIQQDEFLELPKDFICELLSRNDFVVPEDKLFERIFCWAIAECERFELAETSENLRFVLGDALHLIRFPAIPPDVFATDVIQSGLLTVDEKMEVITFFSMDKTTRNKIEKLTYFKTQPRSLGFTLKRFSNIGKDDFIFWKTWKNLCFQVDRDIKIHRLGFYGPKRDVNVQMSIIVKITDEDRIKEFGLLNQCVTVEKPETIFYVDFDSYINISKDTKYTICYQIDGAKTCMGDEILDEITTVCEGSGTVTFKFSIAKFKNNRYQVPEICFLLTD